jgi:hypothetical protein
MRFFAPIAPALIFGLSAATQAQSSPASDSLLRSAVVLSFVDKLSQKCAASGTPSPTYERDMRLWQQTHHVDAMRVRVQKIPFTPKDRESLDIAADNLILAIDKKQIDACDAAQRAITNPNAQFAQIFPDLARAAPAAPVRPAAVPRAAPAKTSAATGISKQIDSFGFDTRMTMGVGGFLTTDIFPIVLFRDGTALTDIKALSNPSGLARHRQTDAEAWVRWRRNGSKVELQKAKGWTALPFQQTYARLPADFRLDGLYRRITGSGTIVSGGTQSATFVSEYRFWRNGTVLRGGAAGATGSMGDSSTVVATAQPDARGRYRVEGLTLSIVYDDGSRESRLLVADPTDAKTAIWLDGSGYVLRR